MKNSFFVQKAIALTFLLVSCSGLEQSEQEKIRQQNAKGEYIYRRHGDVLYRLDPPKHRTRELYPWEKTKK